MKYLVLIYSKELVDAELSEADMNKLLQEYDAYDDALKGAKALIAGEALKPTSTTVRMRNGKVNHTDGPLAETKEQLGGFYLIDVPDLEQALAWAAKCPSAPVDGLLPGLNVLS